MTHKVIDIGNRVICDACNQDWSDSLESGGFLFGSYAYCPNCAKSRLPNIKAAGEESHIREYCPDGVPFTTWVLRLRGGDNRIQILSTEDKDEFIGALNRVHRPTMGQSETRTPYAVICREHGQVFLTEQAYEEQMSRPDSVWQCPICHRRAQWDDDNFDDTTEDA